MVNVAGSAVIGALLGLADVPAEVLALVGTGFCGTLTTFSTFGYETFTLLRTDRIGSALAYVLASVVGGLVASAEGYAIGRSMT